MKEATLSWQLYWWILEYWHPSHLFPSLQMPSKDIQPDLFKDIYLCQHSLHQMIQLLCFRSLYTDQNFSFDFWCKLDHSPGPLNLKGLWSFPQQNADAHHQFQCCHPLPSIPPGLLTAPAMDLAQQLQEFSGVDHKQKSSAQRLHEVEKNRKSVISFWVPNTTIKSSCPVFSFFRDLAKIIEVPTKHCLSSLYSFSPSYSLFYPCTHSFLSFVFPQADSNKTRIDEANQRATKMLGSG